MPEPGPLSLHVPEPAVRPGGTPDFSGVTIPRAGRVTLRCLAGAINIDKLELND